VKVRLQWVYNPNRKLGGILSFGKMGGKVSQLMLYPQESRDDDDDDDDDDPRSKTPIDSKEVLACLSCSIYACMVAGTQVIQA